MPDTFQHRNRDPPASVVLTVWLSMIAAEGLVSRPTRSRSAIRARGLCVQIAHRRAKRRTSGKSSPIRRGARLATAHRMATLALPSGQIIGRGVAILMGAVAAPMS